MSRMYRIGVCLVLILLTGSSWSCSRRIHVASIETIPREEDNNSVIVEEEGAVQEPAWTYYERLSYAFGADSMCVGMRNDMDFPEWYSGCFVNDRDRLTINVVGDTVRLRKMLNEMLGGDEFDLGMGVCSKKEQLRVREQLDQAIAENYSKISQGSLTSGSNEDGTIDLCLEGDDDSIIDRFRDEVFDSPILRFTVAEQVGILPAIEVINTDGTDASPDNEEPGNKKYPAFQFDNGDDYVSDGMYRIVDERCRIGYADEEGNTVIAPRFMFGFPFEDGRAKVTDSGAEKEVPGSGGEYHYWESDSWYYIDKTGKKLVDNEVRE